MAQPQTMTYAAAAALGSTQKEYSVRGPDKDKIAIASLKLAATISSASKPAASRTILAPTPKSAFPLERLPQELQDEIYRAYFDNFVEARSEVADIREVAPTFLNLLHANSKIRADAGAIFNKEYLCTDSFTAHWFFEDELWWRIRSLSALVAVRNIHLPLSITCTTYRFDDKDLRANRSMMECMLASRSSFWRRLNLFLHDQEHDFWRATGREDDRGYRTLFRQDVNPTKGRAKEVFCIEGPLAELEWPETDEGYGDAEDEGCPCAGCRTKDSKDGDIKDEELRDHDSTDFCSTAEDSQSDSEDSGSEDSEGDDFDREDVDEDSSSEISLFADY